MRKTFSSILMIVFCTTSLAAQEPSEPNTSKKRRCQKESCAQRDSTVLSMMGWGIGLFIGIAALCALVDNNPAPTTTP